MFCDRSYEAQLELAASNALVAVLQWMDVHMHPMYNVQARSLAIRFLTC